VREGERESTHEERDPITGCPGRRSLALIAALQAMNFYFFILFYFLFSFFMLTGIHGGAWKRRLTLFDFYCLFLFFMFCTLPDWRSWWRCK
jgi:hypothetical protein